MSCTPPPAPYYQFFANVNYSQWDTQNPGFQITAPSIGEKTGWVAAIASNGYGLLFIGGQFYSMRSLMATSLAVYNGSMLVFIGGGAGIKPYVYAVAVDQHGRIYVAGSFGVLGNLLVNNISYWDPADRAWHDLPYGVNGTIFSLYISPQGDLYAGGSFNWICGNTDCSQGNTRANMIARWTWAADGVHGAWYPLDKGLGNSVKALNMDSTGHLIAGGMFTTICRSDTCLSNDPANHIAIWDDNQWSTMGEGFNASVDALAVDSSNQVYAGGEFTRLCESLSSCGTTGLEVNYIAQWGPNSGGQHWSQLANGVNSNVYALAYDDFNKRLYVGGGFNHICLSPGCIDATPQYANGIASWNGSLWPMSNGVSGIINALQVDEHGDLFVGGAFSHLCGNAQCSTASPILANNVIRWDPVALWSPLGSGIGPAKTSYINSLASSQGRLVVGGWFATAGSQVSANLAFYRDHNLVFLPLLKK